MQVLTQIIISGELRCYENPQITSISSKIIPPSVTAEFQYGLSVTVQQILDLSSFPLISTAFQPNAI